MLFFVYVSVTAVICWL